MNPCALSSDSHAVNHLYGCFRMLRTAWQCVMCVLALGTATLSHANPPDPCAPPDSYELNVQYFCQEGDALCWAASGEIIMNFLGHDVSQCTQVDDANKKINSVTDCCQNLQAGDCEVGGWPHFEDFGFTVKSNQVAMTWDEVREQIYCEGKPFAWSWCDVPCNPSDLLHNIGHMFVVYGYTNQNGIRDLLVYNTEPACPDGAPTGAGVMPNTLAFPYDEYVNGQPDASGQLQNLHWLDMYDITWAGQGSESPATGNVPPASQTTNVTSGASQPQPPGPEPCHQPSTVAARASASFLKRVTEKNFRRYGFGSLQEIAHAKPGVPFAVYYVGLADLRRFRQGTDPNTLLRDSGRVMYPIIAGEKVIESVTLRKRKGRWEASGFGDAAHVRLMCAARERSAERPLNPLGSYFAVRMPVGANSYMIGHREGDALVLTPILKDRRAGFQASKDMPAETVFERLASIAQTATGLQ
jgi:hypothetical protein